MSKIIRIQHSSELAKNTIAIQWFLTNACNYSCSYCSNFLHNGTYKGSSISNIEITLKKIREHFPDKNIFVELTGGEATVYKNFAELIDLLHLNKMKVSILTNGARKIDFYKSILSKIDKVVLSYHPEQANEDHFYELVKVLAPEVSIHINLLMLPNSFNQTYKLAQKLAYLNPGLSLAMQRVGKWPESKINESDLIYNLKQDLVLNEQLLNRNKEPIIQLVKDNEYRSHMLKVYDDGTKKEIESAYGEIHAWQNWECFAGIENFAIDVNGLIYRGVCQSGGPIGNIQTGEINFPEKPIICPRSQCSCGFDILCTKNRS